jgi:hypothetical protein
MINTAGVVFDVYDDNGAYLKKFAGVLPSYIGDAEFLDAEQRSRLPDNCFAAVIRNGDETLRKFACTDRGNTAVSALYFAEMSSALPRGARTKIASNLVSACRYFELEPPTALLKMSSRLLIDSDGHPLTVPKPGEKRGDLSGTSIMPITAGDTNKIKTASLIPDPYVDVTGDGTPTAGERPPTIFALEGRDGYNSFPLDTWAQVKTAAEFFDEQYKNFHPRTRREICVKVASRAEALAVPLSDGIRKYAAANYANDGDMEVAFETRRRLWRDVHDEQVSLLDELLEKRAELKPEVFAEVLARLDISAGADKYWDHAIPDPWASTLGVEKVAEWRWMSGNDIITEGELRKFVQESHRLLCMHFSKELAEGLSKNPVGIFESLPLSEKRVIARLAHQHGDGGPSATISHQ